VALYGFVLLMAAIAYFILARMLIAVEGKNSTLAVALGKDYKGIISVAAYALAIPLAFVNAWLSVALYVSVAAMWFIPDRRIEKQL
jgi:uncharacterized membrane protein